jgi:hypothetical protein
MVFTKVNLVGHTCMQKLEFQSKHQNELNLKFKPHDPYNATKQVQDFIQASTVHSETLFNIVATIVTPRVSQPSP